MNKEIQDFLNKFNFRKETKGFFGIERERFLVDPKNGLFVPRSAEFLTVIDDQQWTYELSACQVEDRTIPAKQIEHIKSQLMENDEDGKRVAEKLGLKIVSCEVAPETMPFGIYPDERYLRIIKTIPIERLKAACRVTGTHIHIGVADIDEALRVYDYLWGYINEFCKLGDHSNGERLQLYKTMAINWEPQIYNSVEQFFEMARAQRFLENPRDCWHLMRISKHGTIELRMFGVTENVDEIVLWVEKVKEIIGKEMRE